MAAANTDLFKKFARRWVGQIGAAGVADASVTTIPLSSATNLPTDTAVAVVIDRVDSSGTTTASLEETVIGVVSGSNLISCTRGVEGTAQAHLAGAVVEVLVTSKGLNDIMDGLLVGHTQLGAHSVTNGSFTNSSMVTPTLNTPKLITSLNDTNNNEIFKVTANASAVNELTLANAATGSNVTTSVTGGDSAVGWDIKMKSTGRMRKPTVVGIQVVDAGTDTATGDGKAFFRVPEELNGMNLTGVAMHVYTAGTTNTTDVQLRRVRSGSAADMLSTKLTIDSTEVDTLTAATPAVINTSNDDVLTGDTINVDVDAVSTTAAQGLFVEMRFELP